MEIIETIMRRDMLAVFALCGVCACGGAERVQGRSGKAPSTVPLYPTAFASLREDILASRATFDGAIVTDLRETARCEAVIVTARGATSFRWADMGNLASRLNGVQTTFSIPAGGRPHTLSARTSQRTDGIDMSLSLLDHDCGGV